jgi:hypothetical protein
MSVFYNDDQSVDYNNHVNILVKNQHEFSVPISTENCGRETPVKTVGKNGYQSIINSINF